jgi:uncharacterized protein YkwD
MYRLTRQIIVLLLVLGVLVYGIFHFSNIKGKVSDLFTKTITEEHADAIISELKKVIITPPPLRHASEETGGTLSAHEVISLTNNERTKAGVKQLTEDSKLDYGAKLKMEDMFKNQYFEHVSPSGRGPAEVAKDAKYEYIIIGENLALGNFKDDAALVAAWMASPGHRANILNTKFTQIGVAVGKGTFEGHTVWLAVQEFGEPLSDCPFPEASLHVQIESLKNSVAVMDDDLKAKKQEISNTPTNDPSYSEKVREYNAEVQTYNNDLATLKDLINKYNLEVKDFNTCANS